jgi:DNA-binding response OmpR family regulator
MRRIVILDTDVERCKRLAFLLRHMGYVVDVHPGEDGDFAMGAEEPDLVLVSEQVMGSGEREVAAWVLKKFDAPKLVLGSEAEEVAGIPYLELGADAYLPAPVNLRLMLARVRSLLNRPLRRNDCPVWVETVVRNGDKHDAGMDG